MLALVRRRTGPIVQILVHLIRREERLPVEETNRDPFRKFPATHPCKHEEQGNDYLRKISNAKKAKSLLSEDFHARLVKILMTPVPPTTYGSGVPIESRANHAVPPHWRNA